MSLKTPWTRLAFLKTGLALSLFFSGILARATTFEPLAWESESEVTSGSQWSEFTLRVIDQEFEKFDQVQDAAAFCPNYNRLTRDQKINFWGMLVSGLAYYESNWRPTSRMSEPSLGRDSVTGHTVYSEGLMQLSYQDAQWAGFCEFDWDKDRHLGETDPHRTILDPYRNLGCGIRILARQIDRNQKIVLSRHVYWSTLRSGSPVVRRIQTMTKSLNFCQTP